MSLVFAGGAHRGKPLRPAVPGAYGRTRMKRLNPRATVTGVEGPDRVDADHRISGASIMALRVAITGFGRIGRLALRAVLEQQRHNEVQVVAINDSSTPQTNAHLLKYDSVHGRYPGEITVGEDWIDAGFGRIAKVSSRDPSKLPWADLGIDIVLECTGAFNSKEGSMAHIHSGAKRVLCSAPAKNADKTIVYGVNHDALTADDIIVSNASCTTNGLAPVAKTLNDAIGIARGHMTTIHAYTGDCTAPARPPCPWCPPPPAPPKPSARCCRS